MIKIEVTGGSIPEVADKLMAIGRSLYTTAVYDADNAAREALQAQRAMGKAPELGMGYHQKIEAPFIPLDPVMPEVAEMAAAPLPSSGQTEASQPTEEKASASSPTEASDAPSEELDFDTDVAPFVLQVVKEKGKPVAQEILSQFGVEKASSLDPAQWPELVATLKAAL